MSLLHPSWYRTPRLSTTVAPSLAGQLADGRGIGVLEDDALLDVEEVVEVAEVVEVVEVVEVCSSIVSKTLHVHVTTKPRRHLVHPADPNSISPCDDPLHHSLGDSTGKTGAQRTIVCKPTVSGGHADKKMWYSPSNC